MTYDKWSEDVWGAKLDPPLVTDSKTNDAFDKPQLYFYFGDRDHWIANATRDKLIATRARTGNGDDGKPYMEIDRDGVPHDFCISELSPLQCLLACGH